MFCEILATPCAGCDGDGPRTDGFAAGDIAWSVADHVDLRCGELPAMFFLCARASESSEAVAILMVVRKGAELKKVPDAIVFQFQLRSTRDVSSQKRENQVRARHEFPEQIEHSRK